MNYNTDTYLQRYKERKRREFVTSVIFWAAIAGIGVVLTFLHIKKDKIQKPKIVPVPIKQDVIICKPKTKVDKREIILTKFFKEIGSPCPRKMSKACLATSKPRLMAAIATKETKGNPEKRATGYKRRHYGAWQLNQYIWGRVSKDPILQAKQAEQALKTILKESRGKMKVALNKFGGDTEGMYYHDVMNHLESVPQI